MENFVVNSLLIWLFRRRHNYSNTKNKKKTRLVSSFYKKASGNQIRKFPHTLLSSKAVQEITQAKRPTEEVSFLCIADCGRVLNSQEVVHSICRSLVAFSNPSTTIKPQNLFRDIAPRDCMLLVLINLLLEQLNWLQFSLNNFLPVPLCQIRRKSL